MRKSQFSRHFRQALYGLGSLGLCSLAAQAQESAAANPEDSGLRLGGYARSWVSFNLQSPAETAENDRGDVSMLRGALSLNADLKTGPLQWKAIARADREYKTKYLQRLEAANQAGGLAGGPGSDIMSLYNRAELREFYVDMQPTDKIRLRLGKQQVVWGETDFFHATDLIHGYDYRWRSFLERDNDELRKPLILLNAQMEIPELGGSLQAIVRPGWDRGQDIGITYDLSGGRWALQPNKTVDFLAPKGLNYDYHHPDGDINKVTGGFKWSGTGSVNYALSYLKAFSPNPVANSAFSPYKKTPSGVLGDFIYPQFDVYGGSLSKEVDAMDAIVSVEVAYQKGLPFNVGTNFFAGALPGFGGITLKNVVVSTLRLDKQLRLQTYLGTNTPSFFSIQLFDTWIQNFKQADDLVDLVGFGAPVKRHTTLLTGFITFSHLHSSINSQLAFGADLSNGDAFLLPSVEFSLGDRWRLLAEADLFFPRHAKQPGQVEMAAHPLGGFAHNNQLLLRLTYQF